MSDIEISGRMKCRKILRYEIFGFLCTYFHSLFFPFLVSSLLLVCVENLFLFVQFRQGPSDSKDKT